MSIEWRDLIRTTAPALATVLGSPAAGLGVKVLADVLLGPKASGDEKADAQTIGNILAGGISPEVAVRIAEAEKAVKLELAKLGVREKEIAADVEKAYLADVQAARTANATNASVVRAAFWINALSYLVVCGVLAGAFAVLLGYGSERIANVDPGIAAMVGSIIGAAVQFIVQNAAQAAGFLFGSSPSARANAAKMADAVESAVKSRAK